MTLVMHQLVMKDHAQMLSVVGNIRKHHTAPENTGKHRTGDTVIPVQTNIRPDAKLFLHTCELFPHGFLFLRNVTHLNPLHPAQAACKLCDSLCHEGKPADCGKERKNQ